MAYDYQERAYQTRHVGRVGLNGCALLEKKRKNSNFTTWQTLARALVRFISTKKRSELQKVKVVSLVNSGLVKRKQHTYHLNFMTSTNQNHM